MNAVGGSVMVQNSGKVLPGDTIKAKRHQSWQAILNVSRLQRIGRKFEGRNRSLLRSGMLLHTDLDALKAKFGNGCGELCWAWPMKTIVY